MKIGLSGYHPKLVKQVDFFEVDAFDVDSVPKAKGQNLSFTLSANQFFYRKNLKLSLRDRLKTLLELRSQVRARRVTLKLTPRFFNLYTLEEELTPIQNLAMETGQCELAIELPLALPRSFKAKKSDTSDPLWHAKQNCKHWKIHGWNENRWVRRYSTEDLTTLAERCIRDQPETLIFAHSQRAVQVIEFKKIYESMIAPVSSKALQNQI